MHDRSSPHRIANSLCASALLVCAGVLSIAPPAPAQMEEEGSANTGTTNNSPLNPATPGVPGRATHRLLLASRIDPSVAFNLNDTFTSVPIAAHERTFEIDANLQNLRDHRERIVLFIAGQDGGGIGDARETGGGECDNCLESSTPDRPLNDMLLGDGPDFDQSGTVDDTDVELMMMAWGYTKGRFDLNKDGVVEVQDLEILMRDYGKTVK